MKHTITFEPDKVSIRVDRGTNLLEAALAAGVHINATCGGQGVCGKCGVIIKAGEVESEKTEKIEEDKYAQGWRQACKTSVLSDCTVLIPVESRGLKRPLVQQLDMGKAERNISVLHAIPLAEGWELDPMAVKVPLRLNPPTAKDNVSDLTRFSIGMRQQHRIDNISADVRCLKAMPRILRANDWFITATLVEDPLGGTAALSGAEKDGPWKLVRIEGGNTSDKNLAVALDIGTTTVSGQLVDLGTGEALAETAQYNGQIQYGADVITRIVFAQKPEGAKKLQSVVVSSINQVIDELLERTGHSKKSISYIAAAGNTTMTHLLLGMETRYIREAPYVPAAASMSLDVAAEIGIDLPDCVWLYTFPSVASYVGGDIVSGILGSGVFQKEELTLYIDIGTNGEIVLGNRDWLACAACSMGPAFEGGGIKHGMRADLGAIEGFHINPVTLEPMVVTVGRAKPRGVCGSGLISVLSELLSACVIDRSGKFSRDLSSTRIRQGRFGYEYVLAWAEDSGTGDDIVITEVDIDNLIRAKGALFAGCLTLLESLSLSFDTLDRVIIAGAFGRYINLEKGKVIGLFPDIPVEKFHFLGNGSLLGARLVCLSRGMLQEVKRIAEMMTNIELSDNQSFMDKYMGALFLPHTEDRLFPHVSHYLETSSDMIREERNSP
ncbi:MAG: ASKHA domain-containing protein [Thermodesulfobacteriota bacterium]|nr:ASKHA domain-containing protein [Thermodesulfobacteriota bacterium]